MLEGNIISKKHSGLIISNGMACTTDNTRFYFIDTPLQRVDAFLFDEAAGDILFEKTVIVLPRKMVTPTECVLMKKVCFRLLYGDGLLLTATNPFTVSN